MKIISRMIVVLIFAVVPIALVNAHVKEYTNSRVPIEINAGQEFVINLKSNATTGFKWEIAGGLDEKIVKLVGSEYNAPPAKRLGAGGRELWKFKAVGKGQTKINLQYARPWEKGVKAVKKETFTVIVK